MFNFCKHCDCKLWSSHSKQSGHCTDCKQPDSGLKDLEDDLNELLSCADEQG